MAGFQERLKSSLQLQLSLALAAGVLLIAALAGGFSFMAAYGEANELQDDTLREVSALLAGQAERLSKAGMSPEAADRLVTLREGIARGTALLDQMLSLARAQAQSHEAAPCTRLRPVLLRVVEDLLPQAGAAGIDLGLTGESEGDPQLPLRQADLYMLVKNLVDNAIRFSPRGSRVDIGVAAAADHAVLLVSDEGPGIPVEEQQQVFAAFYRGAGQDTPGTGLGLAIVAAIAARAGGSCTLSNGAPGRQSGLCVQVRLPLHPAGREPGRTII